MSYQQAAQTHASDTDRRLQAANQIAALGLKNQAGNIADIATLENQGERNRAIRQQDLDVGYKDFLRQSDHPWNQISNLSNALSGAHIPSQALQYEHTPPTPQLNRSGQLAQLAGQALGMKQYGGFKEGGEVAKKSVRKGLPMHSGLPKSSKKRGK
jgi:hypothetical protein